MNRAGLLLCAGMMVGIERKPLPWNRAERGSAIAFVIVAMAIVVLHWLALALDAFGLGAYNWLLLLLDLPSLPLFLVIVYPLELPEPLPFLCQTLLSAAIWGLLAAMPTYIVISRAIDSKMTTN